MYTEKAIGMYQGSKTSQRNEINPISSFVMIIHTLLVSFAHRETSGLGGQRHRL